MAACSTLHKHSKTEKGKSVFKIEKEQVTKGAKKACAAKSPTHE